MRKSTLSQAEIADLDETKKKEARKGGLDLIPVRDRGVHTLSNGVTAYWHHPKRQTEAMKIDGVEISQTIRPKVAEGDFGLEVDGKMVVFNGEELRRWLRWA